MKFVLMFLFSFALNVNADVLLPKTDNELIKTNVKVTNLMMNSGGTGSVVLSGEKGSVILTNKHVCGVIENGGLIEKDGKVHLITHYKKYKDHDLCLVRIRANLGVNLKIAETSPALPEPSTVVGHPALLPTIITKGHFSDRITISIITGQRECGEKDDPLVCMFFGGIPLIEQFDSQVVTSLIMGGSSGSPVFNDKGEVSGVVFAGSEGLSYAFIVPLVYVINFMANRNNQEWVSVSETKETEEKSTAKFDMNKCRELPAGVHVKIKEICKTTKDTLIQ